MERQRNSFEDYWQSDGEELRLGMRSNLKSGCPRKGRIIRAKLA